MRALTVIFVAGLLSSCAANGTYEGRFLDGLSGEPRGEIRVVAKAIGGSNDMTCIAREATAGAGGNFILSDLCTRHSYGLSLPDPSLQIGGKIAVRGGEESMEVTELKVWRAPNGSGLYRLSQDKILRIKIWADVDEVKTLVKGEAIRYPVMKPTAKTRLPTVRPGDHLVLSGSDEIQRLRFVPLMPSEGVRRFQGTTISNHVFIGVEFTTDTVYKRVTASPDETKVHRVVSGRRAYRYLAHDSLPAGRYAVLSDTDNVTYLVDFVR